MFAARLAGLIVIALAVSGASMTVAKAVIFEPPRAWVDSRSRWLGDLITCPYCVSHWFAVGAVAWYSPLHLLGFYPADLAVSSFAVVSLATFSSGLIYRSISSMGGPAADDE